MEKIKKQFHQVMTRAVVDKYTLAQQMALLGAFQVLMRAFPEERHFIIGRAYANDGEGEKVWLIIDETNEERIETMLFPEDY